MYPYDTRASVVSPSYDPCEAPYACAATSAGRLLGDLRLVDEGSEDRETRREQQDDEEEADDHSQNSENDACRRESSALIEFLCPLAPHESRNEGHDPGNEGNALQERGETEDE